MTAQVIDEFLVLDKYRVMVLDREIRCNPHEHYRINGIIFDPVKIHVQTHTDTIPLNYIAIKSKSSFKGSSVEIV